MAILPIIKAVAPYITQIATSAIPAFTSKKETAKSDPVLAKQIEELQAAATQNAQSIQILADKLKQTIEDLEGAAQSAQKQIATYKTMIFCSLGLSAIAIATSLYVIIR
jgi:gas vesicle protein